MQITVQGRSLTATLTVIANGFGVPAPVQQVVQTTYQVCRYSLSHGDGSDEMLL